MATHPRYLRKIRSTYYFRIALPLNIQAKLGSREYLRSLKTDNIETAARMGLNLAMAFKKVFQQESENNLSSEIRKKLKGTFDYVTQYEFSRLADLPFTPRSKDEPYLKQVLKEPYFNTLFLSWLIDNGLEESDSDETALAFQLYSSLILQLTKEASKTLKKIDNFETVEFKSIDEAPKDIKDTIIAEAVFVALAKAHETAMDAAFDEEMGGIENKDNANIIEPEGAPLLSVLFDEYHKEFTDEGLWTLRTQKAQTGTFRVAIEILGDIPIDQFDKNMARKYKANLLKYRKNRTKIAPIDEMAFEDILSSELEYQKISSSTAKGQSSKFKSFIRWCDEHGYIDSNPIINIKSKRNQSVMEDKLPWTESEVNELFSSEIFTRHEMLHPYNFWLPLIALHTGARLEEICQLKTEDIEDFEGMIALISLHPRKTRNQKTSKAKDSSLYIQN